ncbi:MAG TPA: serine hydrolase domain-containing protein, partial [Propionibacteriaceae bacterium]|nr:serine hydrolase domain-containing protein [Propionibacteriaceae bacterium]
MANVGQQQLEARVDEIVARWPAVGLVVGVVRNGSTDFFYRHGVADIEAKTPVNEDTVFRIGSITKTFTAVAVMQLWERGLVDLDAPADDYLRAYRLVPANGHWRPATVRNLLTHTAGVPEWVHPMRMVRTRWFGESFALDEPLPTLAEFYRGALRLAVEPGTIWAYTDHGFATLGQIVEDVSGQPLDRYLRENVFEPLGMATSDLLRSDRVKARLATGYTLGSKGAKALTDRQGVTAAAGSIYSTPRDMARYLTALLGGGSGEGRAILKPQTLAMMFEPHYQPDPRIPGMGLAFWRADLSGHLAVEHQGVVPGFNSQIVLAPDDGVAVMAFTNGSRNASAWLTGETQRLLRELTDAPDQGIRTDVPQRPDRWGDICGWYRPRVQRTDMMAWSMLGAGAEVTVRRGQLTVRTLSPIPALYRGLRLHPDDPEDPYIFRIDVSQYGLGTARIVFSRDAAGATTGLHFEGILLSAEKSTTAVNPRMWARGAAAGLAAAAT